MGNPSKWERLSELKSIRVDHESAIIGSRIYLFGGCNGTEMILINKKLRNLQFLKCVTKDHNM